jgi:hypothetical protein
LEIEHLEVDPAYRGQGIGRGMVSYLCSFAKEYPTPIACTFSAEGKADPLYLFFAELGEFTVEEDVGFVCRIPPALWEAGRFRESPQGIRDITPFFSLDAVTRERFAERLRESFVLTPPALEEGHIPELCLCRTQGDAVTACALMEKNPAEGLTLSYVYCEPDRSPDLFGIFAELRRRLREPEYRNENVYVAAVTDSAARMVQELFPEAETLRRFYTAVWDMDAGEAGSP